MAPPRHGRWPPVPHEEVDPKAPDRFETGIRLHREVAPELWCINRGDLDRFEGEVREAWAAGEIPDDPERANAFHGDPAVGPTIYQVSRHFVQPQTARYGGMSYALMLHPEGLQCDVFATHAWAAGVFELADQLRRGWPRECRHMYFCVLSNPQNVGICNWLLDTMPMQESAFAKAMQSASHLLVVPGRAVSVYTRLWCCYEVYLAYTLDKTILMPPVRYFTREVRDRLMLLLANAVVVALATCLMFQGLWPHVQGVRPFVPVAAFGVVILFLCWFGSAVRKAASVQDLLLQLAASSVAGLCLGVFVISLILDWQHPQKFITNGFAALVAASVACSTVFRRRQEDASAEQALQLAFRSLDEAACSSERDRARILEGITGRERSVEGAIHVLIAQGISTPEMRRATMTWARTGHSATLDPGIALAALLTWVCNLCAVALVSARHFELLAAVAPATVGFVFCGSVAELSVMVARTATVGGVITLLCLAFSLLGSGLADLPAIYFSGALWTTCVAITRRAHVRCAELERAGNRQLAFFSMVGWSMLVLTASGAWEALLTLGGAAGAWCAVRLMFGPSTSACLHTISYIMHLLCASMYAASWAGDQTPTGPGKGRAMVEAWFWGGGAAPVALAYFLVMERRLRLKRGSHRLRPPVHHAIELLGQHSLPVTPWYQAQERLAAVQAERHTTEGASSAIL